tara:strand:+ start:2311 stop:2511 length:201 start_codon:yes stop_codon:yes gene_type:complete
MGISNKTGSVVGKWTIKFGKHKGTKFDNIPIEYLVYLNDEGVFNNDKYPSNKIIREYIFDREEAET